MKACVLGVALCLSAVLTSAAPVVFWASDPVGPDETVLVAGAGFGSAPVVELAPLASGIAGAGAGMPAWPSGGTVLRPEVVQPTEESLKFVLPAEGHSGAWTFRVVGSGGAASVPIRLNCPVVYWLQGDLGLGAASPGGWLRVFGRCVGSVGAGGRVVLRSGAGGRTVSLSPADAGMWSVRAVLPDDLPAGEWDVLVHNGEGGANGWSAAGALTIRRAAAWPDTVFDVREFGSRGRGTMDDAPAIDAALQSAREAGGGIVYLPRGRYYMDHTLDIPENTVLKGEARELVSIFWPDTEEPYVLVQGTHHFGIEDVSLLASNYTHAIAGDLRTPAAGHVFVRRVLVRAVLYRGHLKPEEVDERFRASLRLSTGGGDTIRLGGEHIEVTDCDLYGSGRAIYLFDARGGVVSGNRFYNGRWGWYCLTGSDGVIFENNILTGADLMSTGGGLNCLGSKVSQNVYYADNTIARCHGWDREAMTSDAGHGAYYGTLAAADAESVTLAGEANWRGGTDWSGAGVFIMLGRGMGQYRQIAEVTEDGKKVAVDRAWDVVPDTESLITITMMQRNYLFINNHFEDAGIALQYYGTSIDHVASGNTCERAGGFYNSGRWYRHYQPSWYCQFLDNVILEGNCYRFGPNNATGAGDSFLGTFGLQRGDNPAPLAYCSVLRGNDLLNNAMIRLIGVNAERPGLRDAVVEHNLVRNTETGILVDDGCVGVLERGNRFENVVYERHDPEREKAERMARRAALLSQQEPVFVLSFDRRRGRGFVDESGNHFSIRALGGDVDAVAGFAGHAGRFHGDGFLMVNDREMLVFPKVTISAWILPDHARKGRWGVVAKRNRNAAAPYVLAVRNGTVTFEGTDITGDWSYNLLSEPVLKPGVWSHIAATCEDGRRVRLYCNGELVAEKEVSEPLVDTDQPLTVGYEAWGGIDSNPRETGLFRGLIDEVRIWSRILTPEELLDLYTTHAQAAQRDVERRKKEAEARAAALEKSGHELAHHGGVIWEPVVVETFDEDTLPGRWETLRGAWKVSNGTATCSEPSFLALKERVSAPVRIEYDARSNRPGDLTAFWGTRSEAYKGGYFIGFASNGNTRNKLLRLGEEVAQSSEPLANAGAWHHVIAQVLDGRVQLIVDGKVALDYTDPKPLGNGDTAGVIGWGPAEFDNIRIFTGK